MARDKRRTLLFDSANGCRRALEPRDVWFDRLEPGVRHRSMVVLASTARTARGTTVLAVALEVFSGATGFSRKNLDGRDRTVRRASPAGPFYLALRHRTALSGPRSAHGLREPRWGMFPLGGLEKRRCAGRRNGSSRARRVWLGGANCRSMLTSDIGNLPHHPWPMGKAPANCSTRPSPTSTPGPACRRGRESGRTQRALGVSPGRISSGRSHGGPSAKYCFPRPVRVPHEKFVRPRPDTAAPVPPWSFTSGLPAHGEENAMNRSSISPRLGPPPPLGVTSMEDTVSANTTVDVMLRSTGAGCDLRGFGTAAVTLLDKNKKTTNQ